MKNYLSKTLSIIVLIIAFGCSEEQTVNSIEDTSNELNFTKAQEIASTSAQRRAIHAIIVHCPGNANGTFGPSCPHDLDPSITVYNVYQSPNCPGIFMVWVDSLEYIAVYGEESPTGTRHVLLPPYEDDPQAVPRAQHDPCFL